MAERNWHVMGFFTHNVRIAMNVTYSYPTSPYNPNIQQVVPV